ncbi:MAG: glycoside hydrolase 43 family protein [Opitutaceae bacterium]|jgi:beta-xylosidase|nr:glycoside hydrolase 43 family protein [Opitutaceae bacterium]
MHSAAAFPSPTPRPAWRPDLGDGTYKNPVLNADYSDPDAIRVGDDYWLTSSSFCHVPGLPVLHSRDLVNWTLVNHALPALVPREHYAGVRHGHGVWAPALRRHAGLFWIYYPDPDFGIYAITARDPRGEWSAPVLVKGGKGLIDPCPLWDDDGRVWLVHGWAKSRSGICNIITLHRLAADALSVADEGRVILDGNAMPGWNTIEGPKCYKRNGWYYIFAPAGGVGTGYQAVFRSRDIGGPYENRITLERGDTHVNGPHQGAWVDTPLGEHWFLHFQEIPAMGRVVHLQPMTWGADDWPRMGTAAGSAAEGDASGRPVLRHAMPRASASSANTGAGATEPATSDDFSSARLGRQWQWQANPRETWARIDTAAHTLHLACVPAPAPHSHWLSPNLLLQKFPAPAFTATVAMRFAPSGEGAAAGLMVFGYNYAWLGLRREDGVLRLLLVTCHDAHEAAARERIAASAGADAPAEVLLRVTVTPRAECRFSRSDDGKTFMPIGGVFQAASSRWVGAKVGLFASAPPDSRPGDSAAFRQFTVTA